MKPATTSDEIVPLHERFSLSVAEAALLSGLSITLLSEAITAGLLRASRIGKRRMILRRDLEKLIESGTRRPLRVRAAYLHHLTRRTVERGE